MKWLRNRLRRYLNNVMYEVEEGMDVGVSKVSSDMDSRPNSDPVLRFRVYTAQNGKILEFDKYDRINDRSENTVYIISKDEDIADKVSKCVSLELLK